jgi:hypothetical protein
MSRNVRSIAFALLLVLVSAPAAQALPLGEAGPGNGLLDRFVSWIGALLSPAAPDLTAVWETAGSSMDPNGEPQNNNNAPAPNSDEGSQMDPNG